MDCVEWEKARDKNGYGRVGVDGKIHYAHRVAYCRANGLELVDISGVVIRHTCDNPACVNPEHLVSGTQADNVQDMVDRGRHKGTSGVRFSRKLSIEDQDWLAAVYIPYDPEFNASALGRMFNVSATTVKRLARKHRVHSS